MARRPASPAESWHVLDGAAHRGRAPAHGAARSSTATAATGSARLALVGIHTRGVEVARRLAALIEEAGHPRPRLATLDISMHRDDLRRRARLTSIQPTRLPMDLDVAHGGAGGRRVFHGPHGARGARRAGRLRPPGADPARALVDRGHRELPIRPDYTGWKWRPRDGPRAGAARTAGRGGRGLAAAR